MGCFFRHDWRKDGEPTFTPPVRRGFNAEGFGAEELMHKAMFGFTTQPYKCSRCQRRKLQDYMGDQRSVL